MSAVDEHQVHEVPAVARTIDGHVQLTLSVDDADVLKQVLGHYDVLTSTSARELAAASFTAADLPDAPALTPARGYVPEVWHHTLIRLAVEIARIQGQRLHAGDVSHVDISGTTFARSAR